MGQPQPKLLDQVRARLRSKHYARRTEESYIDWITRYVRFHQMRHPRELGPADISAFLTHLAVDLKVAASTLNQARSALLFLYREVLGIAIDAPHDVVAANTPQRLPTVLSKDEVRAVLAALSGEYRLMAQLLYGSGLRLMECLRLRVKDLDFTQRQLLVRDGKGEKDRLTMLPEGLVAALEDHLRLVRRTHEEDLERGYGAVYLPFALERKYPQANREWGWQYVFPAERVSVDPRSGAVRRHHRDERGLQAAVKAAVRAAAISKPASCHTFRHSFATQLLENYVELHKLSRSSFSSANHPSWMPVWGRFSFAKETCPHTPAKERHAARAGAQAPTPSPAPPSPPSPLLSLLLPRPSACRCITGVAPS